MQGSTLQSDDETRRTNSRSLDYFEQILHVGNRHGIWLMARTVLLSGRIDPERLTAAVREVHQREPLLQSTIVTRGGRARLVYSADLQPPRVVVLPRTAADSWQSAATLAIEHPFAESETLWRVTLLQSADSNDAELILTLHHSICDGTSGTRLVNWILSTYAALEAGQSCDTVLPARQHGLLPIAKRTPLAELAYWLRQGFQGIGATLSLQRSFNLRADAIEPRVAQRRTQPCFLAWDSRRSRTLTQRCHEEQTSVHQALCLAMLLAAQEERDPAGATLSCFSNIDRRRHDLTERAEQFGCLTYYVVTHYPTLAADNFWELARASGTQLQRQIQQRGQPPAAWLGPLAGWALPQLLQSRRMGRTQTVGVSNLGQVELPETFGTLRVRGMYSLTGQHGLGPDVMLLASTVLRRLHMTLCFVEPHFSPRRQQEFASRFEAILARACGLQFSSPRDENPITMEGYPLPNYLSNQPHFAKPL